MRRSLLAAAFAALSPSWASAVSEMTATAAAATARIRSADIVYSDRALSGAPVILIEQPRLHAAGVSVPAGVAALYGKGGSDGVNHHQSGHTGEPGEDKGRKLGWRSGDEKDDDDRGENGGRGGHDDDDRASGHRDDGDDRKNRMPVPLLDNELIMNHEFAHGLQNWEHSEGAYTTEQFGPISADASLTRDGVFAVAHNGLHNQLKQGHLQQNVQVPMARNAAFAMLYNFVTTEYPSWQGSEFNDNFRLSLTGPSGEITLSKAEFLNSGSFSRVTGVPLGGWDYDGQGNVIGGQTGWQTFSSQRLPLKSGIYTVRIEVNDVGDTIVDSAILVDRVSLR